MKKKLTVLFLTFVLGAGVLLILPTMNAQPIHTNMPPGALNEPAPRMTRALRELEMARGELASAKHDFGGHRAAALKACDEAIKEVKDGLKFFEQEKH